MTIDLRLGDCLEIMPTLPENSVDSIITDPPYGLSFMGKDWDHGIPGAPFWKAALRVAKPGAMLLAFGGTRTHHRLMCAIEDAEWEIRDCLCWLYGSGFPKSHDLSKAIDKAAGTERKINGTYQRPDSTNRNYDQWNAKQDTAAYGDYQTERRITAPATPAAQLWDGWGTALKPAYEPIILAMKPRDGTFANNALTWGVAGLNVDGCRAGTNGESWKREPGRVQPSESIGTFKTGVRSMIQHPQGRWPANLILSHSPECRRVGVRKVGRGVRKDNVVRKRKGHKLNECIGAANSPDNYGTETVEAWECVEGCPVRMLDEQSGERPSGGRKGYVGINPWVSAGRNGEGYITESPREADTGGASRFFYCAKASRSERTCSGEIENGHPTVKPLALCRWLCRLTKTPTRGVVLDPFLGSGSILIAAILEGRDAIGIELERESFDVAQARIAHAQAEMIQPVMPGMPVVM